MIAAPMLTRRELLATGGTIFGALACESREDGNDSPLNVLFLFPDQMRAQAMGCMGNPDVKTPNLDRLAQEGVLFRNHYANSPVCCPARAMAPPWSSRAATRPTLTILNLSCTA